jgi:predicted transposase/invertase (TIGR01784 family)
VEVENMLYTHFDWDKALQAARDDAREDGIERGIEQGIERGIEQGIERGIEQGIERGKLDAARAMLEKGLDVSFISEITKLNVSEIEALKNR